MASTLGNFSQKAVIERALSGTINLAFTAVANKTFPVGASVQLTSTGLVDTATTPENIVGIVVVPEDSDGKVVVATPFTHILNAQAKGTIAAGALVSEDGADTLTNAKLTVAATAATAYSFGRALEGSSNGNNVRIGVFFTPIRRS